MAKKLDISGEDFRLPTGAVDLSKISPGYPAKIDADKQAGESAMQKLSPELADLQEQLFADGRAGGTRNLLLVLQGMDTSGKGGVISHVLGMVDPQGVTVRAFKAPTQEDLRHDFLWRIKKALPDPGIIGVFDRSHYEDVLIARVRELAPAKEIERRYDAINEFEKELTDQGTTVVKCFLHVSAEAQKKRLLARLDDETKYWKFNPGDIDERALWPEYQQAYEIALERTNTAVAPWFVMGADHKWFRNLAVATLLRDQLSALKLTWPPANFDVDEQRSRLLAES